MTSSRSASTVKSSYDEESGIVGVWVAGVAPGSPADDVDLLPGDIIQTMNGIPIGTDGTMADYCDVLRTSGDHPIKIEVLRFDTSEILTGEINGDEPLEQTFSFAEAVEEEVDVEDGDEAETYDSYQTIVDDTGTLTVDLPDGVDLDRHRADHARRRFVAPADHRRHPTSTVVLRHLGHAGHLLLARAERRHPPGAGDLRAVVTPAPTAASTSTRTPCSSAPISCGPTVAEPTRSSWCSGPSTVDGSRQVAVLTAQVVTDADLDALDQAFATFNVTG